MSVFCKKAHYLLIVAVWLVFAPSCFQLHRLYANETVPVHQPETEEGEAARLADILDELETTAQQIKSFNQQLFHQEEADPQTVLRNADLLFGQILARTFLNVDDEVSQELNGFYETLMGHLLGAGQQAQGAISLNKTYSGHLSTILTWGRWLQSGQRFSQIQKVDANIAVSMLRGLANVSTQITDAGRRAIPPVRYLIRFGERQLPLLRRGATQIQSVLPGVSQAFRSANRVLGPLGLVMSASSFMSNSDVQAGIFNYETLTQGIDLVLGSLSMALAFLTPASVILATIGLVYFGTKIVVEMIARHFARRMEAYRASYEFLMIADPSFPVEAQSYRELDGLTTERDILNKYYLLNREKLTSFVLAGSENSPGVEQSDAINQQTLELYKAIWSAKADVMATRGRRRDLTENLLGNLQSGADSNVRRTSIFEGLPGVGRSREERRQSQEELGVIMDDFHPLLANPDFALIVLFDNYAEFSTHNAEAEKIAFLQHRVMQNPFLFPYLLEIPQARYNDEIFEQAIAVDSVNTGWLELGSINQILQESAEVFNRNLSAEQRQGILGVLRDLYIEAEKMNECTRALLAFTDIYLEDEEAQIDIRGIEHLAGNGSWTHLRRARQVMAYLDEFTEENLAEALEGEDEIPASDLFNLAAFQDAVNNFTVNAAMINANFFANQQKAETIASQNELVLARLLKFLAQAQSSMGENQQKITHQKILDFYSEGRFLGEREGGILGFISGLVPVRERYEEEVARLEHSIRELARVYFEYRKGFSTVDKAREIAANIQSQNPDFDLSVSGRTFIREERTPRVIEWQQQLKELLEKVRSIDSLTITLDPQSDIAEEIFLKNDFEIREYSLKANLAESQQ